MRRGFVALLAAEAISIFGSRMTFVAVPWLVLVTTGSATRTGVVAFAEMLPYVLVSAAGGPWVDRFGPARTSVVMVSPRLNDQPLPSTPLPPSSML